MQHLLTLRFIWLNSFFGKGISAWFISETRTNVPSDGTFSFRENHASFLLRSFTPLLNNRQLPPSQVKMVDYSEMPSRTDKVMQEWDCAHSSGYVHWIVKIYACHVCTWQMCHSPHCLQLVAFFLSSGCDWGSQALASRYHLWSLCHVVLTELYRVPLLPLVQCDEVVNLLEAHLPETVVPSVSSTLLAFVG